MLQVIHRILGLLEGRDLSRQEMSRLHSEVLYLEEDLEELVTHNASLESEIENLRTAEMARSVAEVFHEEKPHRAGIYGWMRSMNGSLTNEKSVLMTIIKTLLFTGIWPMMWYLLTRPHMTLFPSFFYIFYVGGSFLFAIASPVFLEVGGVHLCNIYPNIRPLKLLVIAASIAYLCYIIWIMFMRDMTVFDYIHRAMTTPLS